MIRVSGQSKGYTIVETMIFLGVTAVLFVSVIALVGGKQGSAQFTQSIQTIDSKIQDVINDVATGYYNNTNNFSCTVPVASSQPTLGAGTNNQGSNEDCIFVGRVMQFTKGSDYHIYTMVGRRIVASTGQEVSGLYESRPVVIDRGTSATPYNPLNLSATDSNLLDSGLNVTKMYFVNSVGTKVNVGAVGFFSTFAKSNTTGSGIASGSATTELLPIAYSSSDINKSRPDMVDDIVNYLNPFAPPPPGMLSPPETNPPNGVIICFKSGGTDQYAVLTIGSNNNRQLTTKVDILNSAVAVPAVGTGVCT